MVYCTLLVALSSINNLLTTIWPLLALFHIASIYDLFLVALENLSRMRGNCTTTPLFETKPSSF